MDVFIGQQLSNSLSTISFSTLLGFLKDPDKDLYFIMNNIYRRTTDLFRPNGYNKVGAQCKCSCCCRPCRAPEDPSVIYP